MKLATVRVANWSEFVRHHSINLECDCDGTGCEKCTNCGQIWPTADVAYDSGYEVAGWFPRRPYHNTVAFELEHRIWLAYAGTEDDHAPYLGMAWINLFPKCEWLPEQFGDAKSVEDYRHFLPLEDARQLTERLRRSLELQHERCATELQLLDKIEQQHET